MAYAICYGIVKGKMPTKGSYEIKAKDYEAAIRILKKDSKNNYRDYYHQCTLFYNGHAVGWCVREAGDIIYLDKDKLQRIGLMPKRRN